jgi:hypothetical protein
MESTRSSRFRVGGVSAPVKVTGQNGDSKAVSVFFHEIKTLGKIRHEVRSSVESVESRKPWETPSAKLQNPKEAPGSKIERPAEASS